MRQKGRQNKKEKYPQGNRDICGLSNMGYVRMWTNKGSAFKQVSKKGDFFYPYITIPSTTLQVSKTNLLNCWSKKSSPTYIIMRRKKK